MVFPRVLVKVLLICLITVLQIGLITVYAQEPDLEEPPIIIDASGRLDLTLKQFGFETRVANREQPRRFYRIPLPGNLEISSTGNYLDLVTSHLPEAPDKPSLLEVRVNSDLISTIVLTRENAISNTTRLNLPTGLLQSDQNFFDVRLNVGETCDEPGAFINVLIHDISTLSFEYQQRPYPADLGQYPYPFTEKSLVEIPVTVVLPDQPTSNDLSAAATIAAGLGRSSGGSINLQTVLVSNLTPDIQNNNHLIFVGTPDAHGLIKELSLPLSLDNTILKPGHGVLQEVISPWNEFRLVLVVTGLDDEGLLKASQALNRQAHFLGMRGPVAIVVELGPLSHSSDSSVPGFTFASLGYDDEIAYGIEPQEYLFEFTLPLGWQLQELPFVVLKFAHAEILTAESVIDVKLNNVPIGSTLLDDSNATEGELTVSMPARLLKTGNNRLTVGVEMEISNSDPCDDADNQRAWTVISSESEISLPYSAVDIPLDLGLFPYPFSQVSGFNQSLFVLPDGVFPETFNQLIQLAVRLGSASRVEQILAQVKYASEMDEESLQNHNLILLGRPTANSVVAEINDHLPQPFVADSDTLKPLVVDTVAFLPDPGRDAGLLQIIGSPWNEEYNILVITGTTEEGVDLGVVALLVQTNQLNGNLAVVEPVLNPFSDEPSSISTYSIDTRTVVEKIRASTDTDNTISNENLSIIANRWWR